MNNTKEWATDEEIRSQLARHDFKFWYDRTKVAQGRKHIEGILGKRIRASDFKRLRGDRAGMAGEANERDAS